MAHLLPELTALKAKIDAKGRSISQEEQMKMAQDMMKNLSKQMKQHRKFK
jgi:hypothetical protein